MTALIVVDVQNDFVPGGALAVTDGNKVVPVINKMLERLPFFKVATVDWHPADHGSFASNHEGKKVFDLVDLNGLEQVLWPSHCIQYTEGAAYVRSVRTDLIEQFVPKGCNPEIDSYSGFYDNGKKFATALDPILKGKEVKDVYICGLALDYCVKFTALDAVALGYNTHVVVDACKGVNLNEGDVEKAIKEMTSAGIVITQSFDIFSSIGAV